MSDITIASTTDAPEAVAKAAGESAVPAEAAAAAADQPKGDEPKDDKAKQETSSAATPAEEKAKTDDGSEPDEEEEQEPKVEKPGDPPKKKGGYQKKIDKLTRDKADLERRLAKLEQGKPEEKQPKEPAAPAGERKPGSRPVESDYEDYSEYTIALADWRFDEREKAKEEQQTRAAVEADTKKVLQQWDANLNAARERYEDFDEVMEAADIPVPPIAQRIIYKAERGADLAYYLATHPEEAKALITMSDEDVSLTMGRLDAKLTEAAKAGEPAAPVTQQPPKRSAAPEPLKPIGGKASVSTKPLDEVDYQEYKRARAKK